MIPIPQCNPGAGVAKQRAALLVAIQGVLDSGRYILGSACKAFEEAFAAYHGVRHAVGVANGTDALELILRALDVGPGDHVVTVANTAVATVAAIGRTGAAPRFADIDADTLTMSPLSLERVLGLDRAAKAVIVVHLFGQPADMAGLQAVAGRYGVPVVEDCAQAHGATWQQEKAGTLGRAGAFSFYPTKNLAAVGDGGAVITRDSALAERVRMLRQYGWRERYVSDVPGVNSRLDELQAAILLARLPQLDADNESRRAIARLYRRRLADLRAVRLPVEQAGTGHVYHQFVVRVPQRADVMRALEAAGVGTAIHYPVAIHRQPAYRGVPLVEPLPETERANEEILSLPMFPELTAEQAERVCAAVTAAVSIGG